MKQKLLSIFALLLMAVGAMAQTITVTWNNSDITGKYGQTSFTKGDVTITANKIVFDNKNFTGPGTFTTTLGNFTKIEVTAKNNVSGAGWSGDGNATTWTGNASSVSFSGNIMGNVKYGGNINLVFTIEGTSAVSEVKADGAQVAGKKKFFKDGKLVIEDANGSKFNAAGAQMK